MTANLFRLVRLNSVFMLALLLLHFTENRVSCMFVHFSFYKMEDTSYLLYSGFFSFSFLAAQYNLLTFEDIKFFFYIEVTLKLCLFLLLLPVTFLTREAPV